MAHSSRQIPPTCLTSYIFAIRLDPHRLNNPEKLFCSADKLPLAFRTLLLRWTSGPPPPPRPPPPQDSSSFACWHPQQPFRTSLEASANQTTLQMIKGRSRRRRERRRGKRRNGCHFVIKVPLTPEGANWTLPACGSSSRRRRRRRRADQNRSTSSSSFSSSFYSWTLPGPGSHAEREILRGRQNLFRAARDL